ncbi:MAG TPA: hypothetical protein VJG83_04180 [archaeon]|nr:hypothetical protein [archaeon]
MGIWLKTAVDSIFWNAVIILFHFLLDIITNVDFAPLLYEPTGIFISYIATFVYLFNLNWSKRAAKKE